MSSSLSKAKHQNGKITNSDFELRRIRHKRYDIVTVEGVEFAEKGRSLDEGDLTKRGSKPSLTMSDLTKNLTASNVELDHVIRELFCCKINAEWFCNPAKVWIDLLLGHLVVWMCFFCFNISPFHLRRGRIGGRQGPNIERQPITDNTHPPHLSQLTQQTNGSVSLRAEAGMQILEAH